MYLPKNACFGEDRGGLIVMKIIKTWKIFIQIFFLSFWLFGDTSVLLWNVPVCVFWSLRL